MTAQSNAERQAAYRERIAKAGRTEVRGVFLPPELHAALKAHAKKLLKQSTKIPTNGQPKG